MSKPLPELPRGLSWRKYDSGATAIQIAFTYKGVKCREVLPDLKPTRSDMNYAKDLLTRIKGEITRGEFEYIKHFPSSKKVELFGEAKKKSTLKDYLDQLIDLCERKEYSRKTIKEYTRIINTTLKNWHHILVVDIDHSVLKNFCLAQKTSIDTVKKAFYVISNALNEAVTDNVIKLNPCAGFKVSQYIGKKQRVYTTVKKIDPFLPAECRLLIQAGFEIQPEYGAMVQVWLNTGLRTSELIGLRWEDVNFNRREIRIERVLVDGEIKDPKTENSARTVNLNDDAYNALMFQKQFTYFKQSQVFMLKNENFYDAYKVRDHVWEPVIKRSQVRYRRGYNCRHTFASSQLSKGINAWALAQQLGHTKPTMLEKHYGTYKAQYVEDTAPIGLSLQQMEQYLSNCKNNVNVENADSACLNGVLGNRSVVGA